MYVHVALCLDAPEAGRFTLSEEEQVPDATLRRTCYGSYRRLPRRVLLQVEACEHAEYGEQRHEESTWREERQQSLEAVVRSPDEIMVRTTWGDEVDVRRR